MSDNKTIQDALAEVQRKVNEERSARVAEMISEVQRGERYNPKTGKYEAPPMKKLKPDTSVGKQTLTPEAPKAAPSTPKPDVAGRMSSSGTALGKATGTSVPPTGAPSAATTGKTLSTLGKVGGAASMAGTGALGAAAVGGMASGALGALATGTQTGRDVGKWIGQNVPGAKTAAEYMRKAGETIGVREPSKAPEIPKPTETPKTTTPTTPKPAETPKPTKPGPETFGKAFSAAREKATEMGKPSTGQFEFKGKQYQTNIAGEKYVPMSQQTKVDSVSTPKPADVPLPPKRPADLSKPAPEESESGGKKKKMSEETNPLIAAFLKLQSENPSNMFEAAKKMSPKEKSLAALGHPKDKITKKDVLIGRGVLPKEVEEGALDPNDSDVTAASKTITKKPYVDPSTPTEPYKKAPVSTAAGDVLDKAKNALDKTGVKEEAEVTFSQAELDHINSFFLEASVAPNRPEVAIGADSTSDKMSQNDVTGTHTESGKKKIRAVDEAKRARTEDGLKGSVEYDTSSQNSKVSDETPDVSPIKSKIPPGASWTMTDKPGGIITRSRGETPTAIITRSRGETPRAIITKEETDAADETNMAKTQLKAMASKAKNLHSKLKTSKNLPAWVQSKLAVAKDGVTSVDDYMTHSDKVKEEVELEEGRPKKNPTPETMERDPRKHIQVEAGRAAAGNVIDFHHNDGTKSKLTPAMGRKIVAHLNNLKPADRQTAVNKMHDSAEGLKV